MPGHARRDIVRQGQIGVYHTWSRCVQRAHLCGEDPVTRNNFEHRRDWIKTLLEYQGPPDYQLASGWPIENVELTPASVHPGFLSRGSERSSEATYAKVASLDEEKGVGTHLPERPGGCCAQMSPDPMLFGPALAIRVATRRARGKTCGRGNTGAVSWADLAGGTHRSAMWMGWPRRGCDGRDESHGASRLGWERCAQRETPCVTGR